MVIILPTKTVDIGNSQTCRTAERRPENTYFRKLNLGWLLCMLRPCVQQIKTISLIRQKKISHGNLFLSLHFNLEFCYNFTIICSTFK